MRSVTAEQFNSRLVRKGKCLIYIGPRGATAAHAQLRFRGRVLYAAQVAWLLDGRTIAPGMNIKHTCGNKRCCYLPHLAELPSGGDGPPPKLSAQRVAIVLALPPGRGCYGILPQLARAWGVTPGHLCALRSDPTRRKSVR